MLFNSLQIGVQFYEVSIVRIFSFIVKYHRIQVDSRWNVKKESFYLKKERFRSVLSSHLIANHSFLVMILSVN